MKALHLVLLGVLSLLPALFWCVFLLQKKIYTEPFKTLVYAFILGMLSTIPILVVRGLLPFLPLYLISPIWLTIVTVVTVAALEEISKHSGSMIAMHQDVRAMDERTDGIVYGIIVGLGFAFVENAIYLWSTYVSQGITPAFWYVYIVRSLLTMVGHALFSGTFGYFYGISYIRPYTQYVRCSPLRLDFNSLLSSISLRNFFFYATYIIWSKKTDKEYSFNALEVLFEGYILVILLHIFFNTVLSLPIVEGVAFFILIPFMLLLADLLFMPFAKKDRLP